MMHLKKKKGFTVTKAFIVCRPPLHLLTIKINFNNIFHRTTRMSSNAVWEFPVSNTDSKIAYRTKFYSFPQSIQGSARTVALPVIPSVPDGPKRFIPLRF